MQCCIIFILFLPLPTTLRIFLPETSFHASYTPCAPCSLSSAPGCISLHYFLERKAKLKTDWWEMNSCFFNLASCSFPSLFNSLFSVYDLIYVFFLLITDARGECSLESSVLLPHHTYNQWCFPWVWTCYFSHQVCIIWKFSCLAQFNRDTLQRQNLCTPVDGMCTMEPYGSGF